jgi:methyl-accepting chemotaxis protein
MLSTLRFGHKLRLLGISVLLCASAALVFVGWQNERGLYRQKTERTRNIVESAATLVQHHVNEAREGRVTVERAKAQAMAELADMRYDGQEYFWVNDMTPRMLMHPMKPELNGKPIGDMADPKGKKLFLEMVDVVRRHGGGLVAYEWPRPGKSRPQPKISYVQGVAEWGWIVGSGVYLDDVQAAVNRQRMLLLIVFACAWLASGLLTHLMADSITRNLGALKSALARAAEGDLTVRADARGGDELAEMAAGLNRMLEQFRSTLADVRRASRDTTSAGRQLTGAAKELASGAQEQAASLEETAASLEQMTSAVKQNADNAQQAAQLAQGAREVAEQGGQVVGSAVAAMSEINTSSRKIADIITAIDEIAFQTNLLALNAAVEAARAGEQGRGFAVVAAEVRNLAQRSASSAKEIKGLIHDSVQKVETGSTLVNQSGATLAEIVSSVKRVTDIVAEIAASSREQSTGIEQVNTAATQMDSVTQTNASQTEELAGTADGLSQQARAMMELVGRFQLG